MSDQDTGGWRVPRWLKLTLAGSLAVNIAVLGLAGGLFWRVSDHKGHEGRAARGEFALIAALERADRRVVLGRIRSEVPQQHESFAALRAELLAALRADEFDTELVAAVLSRQAALRATHRHVALTVWMGHMAAQTPEARHRYADRLERWRPQKRRPKRH